MAPAWALLPLDPHPGDAFEVFLGLGRQRLLHLGRGGWMGVAPSKLHEQVLPFLAKVLTRRRPLHTVERVEDAPGILHHHGTVSTATAVPPEILIQSPKR